MRKPSSLALTLLLSAFLILPAQAQSGLRLEAVDPSAQSRAGTSYNYLFENERFTTPLIQVSIDGEGRGKFRFRRKGGDEIVNDLVVTPALVNRIQGLFDQLRFLESTEDYQFKKDFSHLGRMTITLRKGGGERSATFNYTTNPTLNELAEIFRNIATQENRVFEIETIRANDPISTPAQLRLLDQELRGKHIAEPQRLIPLLKDIKEDESVPLIARNHAERLLQLIAKMK
jgi:hypothetical protein